MHKPPIVRAVRVAFAEVRYLSFSFSVATTNSQHVKQISDQCDAILTDAEFVLFLTVAHDQCRLRGEIHEGARANIATI